MKEQYNIFTHTVSQNGITYYMTDEEYEHADEWIQAIEDEKKLRDESWNRRKAELYDRWQKEKKDE